MTLTFNIVLKQLNISRFGLCLQERNMVYLTIVLLFNFKFDQSIIKFCLVSFTRFASQSLSFNYNIFRFCLVPFTFISSQTLIFDYGIITVCQVPFTCLTSQIFIFNYNIIINLYVRLP